MRVVAPATAKLMQLQSLDKIWLGSRYLGCKSVLVDFLPANIPTVDPIAACKKISGEEMSRATRKMPPVQGFPQPYT